MNGTIFDLIEDEPKKGIEGFWQLAEKAPTPKDDSWLNSMADYGKTILKGSVEGVSKLGRMMGPLQLDEQTPQILEKQTESLNEMLPTEDTLPERMIRRGLKEAPSMMAMPGSAVQAGVRTVAGAGAAELAKDFGVPEWGQSAIELTGFIGPDITKKLLSAGSDKKLIDFAKKMGMTDEQITPLIQSDFKQKWLSWLTPKRGKTESILKESKKGLDDVAGAISNSEKAVLEISETNNGKLINGIYEKMNEMPREFRDVIEKDLNDLLNNKITGKSLINFWRDINKTFKGDKKQLGTLKEPIRQALETLSPELAKDFEMSNKLYAKYYPIANKLKPNLVSDLVQAGEILGLGGTLVFGGLSGGWAPLVHMIGEKATRKLAQQMLLNPHFQQLSKKMVIAINQNKFGLANKVLSDLKLEVGKYSMKAANEIKELTLDEFEQLSNPEE